MKRLNINFKKKDIILFTLVVVTFVSVTIYKSYTKQSVLKGYEITTGKIVNFSIIGMGDDRYIKYYYKVDNKKYFRKISIHTKKYDHCFDDINSCLDIKFWVIYSSKNPSKSLIDVTMEIQGMEDPPFPENLDHFK